MATKILTWKEIPSQLMTQYTYNDFNWLSGSDLLLIPSQSELGTTQVQANQCVSQWSLYSFRDFDLTNINTKPSNWSYSLRWTPRDFTIYSKELFNGGHYTPSEQNPGINIQIPSTTKSDYELITAGDLTSPFNFNQYLLKSFFVVPQIKITVMQNNPNSEDRVLTYTTSLTDLQQWLQKGTCDTPMTWNSSQYAQYFYVQAASVSAASLPEVSLNIGNVNIGSTSFDDNAYINIQCLNTTGSYSPVDNVYQYDGTFHAGSVLTDIPNFQTSATSGQHTISFDITMNTAIETRNLPGPPISIPITDNLLGRLNITFTVNRV